jgi:uncharacterized protein (DUF2235 family)
MARNIVIFSDGTGARGGVLVDENRSNIYKLFRATRCGPDTTINPAEQLAFYDPGIGTLPPGGGFLGSLWQRTYNLVSQALGLGLTANIIDCYAAIIELWRPGDRIFMFGFSRGAYTIRCLAATVCRCGVPTKLKNNQPMKYDAATTRKLASEAVKCVYQHTSSWERGRATPRQKELLDQRDALSLQYRQAYGAGSPERANAYPHFVGVFDTVASLSNPIALVAFLAAVPIITALVAWVLWLFLRFLGYPLPWWELFGGLTLGVAVMGLAAHTASRVRVAFGLPGHKWYRTLHLTEGRMNFYDKSLDPNVGFARHAISIDESRNSFQRVPWGDPTVHKSSTPRWFEQLWFAGNHSDIGGSYPENSARLSDISLQWMVDAATTVGLKINPTLFQLNPDPAGPQHDETKSSVFKYAKKLRRRIGHDFPLHPSVIDRFKADPVLHYDEVKPYRPDNLQEHDLVKPYYR